MIETISKIKPSTILHPKMRFVLESLNPFPEFEAFFSGPVNFTEPTSLTIENFGLLLN